MSKTGASDPSSGPVVGDPAPQLALADPSGQSVSLRSLRGRSVVIFFVPKAMTPGCTREACAFAESLGAFEKRGAAVLGVCPDPVERAAKFAEAVKARYPMLADPDHAVCERFGVWREKSMYGRKYWGVVRTTFVIDPKGRVALRYENAKPEGHVPAAMEAIDAIAKDRSKRG